MSDQTRGFFATNWFKLFFVAFAIVLLLIYFERESALDSCMEQAAKTYNDEWQFQCKQDKKAPNCALIGLVADKIESGRAKRADECIKRYSFK
jgi:hypothetical protein